MLLLDVSSAQNFNNERSKFTHNLKKFKELDHGQNLFFFTLSN